MTYTYMQALTDREKQLKIMHINTQSMVSTFDDLLMTLRQYPFDVITMSETWLKDNELLLQHVAKFPNITSTINPQLYEQHRMITCLLLA